MKLKSFFPWICVMVLFCLLIITNRDSDLYQELDTSYLASLAFNRFHNPPWESKINTADSSLKLNLYPLEWYPRDCLVKFKTKLNDYSVVEVYNNEDTFVGYRVICRADYNKEQIGVSFETNLDGIMIPSVVIPFYITLNDYFPPKELPQALEFYDSHLGSIVEVRGHMTYLTLDGVSSEPINDEQRNEVTGVSINVSVKRISGA